MLKNNHMILVNFAMTPTTKEAEELRRIAYLQTTNQEKWKEVQSLATLQARHDLKRGYTPDFNFLVSIVFEAGRITGIRDERKRRKCTITEKP